MGHKQWNRSYQETADGYSGIAEMWVKMFPSIMGVLLIHNTLFLSVDFKAKPMGLFLIWMRCLQWIRSIIFYWVSTRDYPDNIQNLQHGVFDPTTNSVPKASHVEGDFYVDSPECCWITMDQELNVDGSLLFYVNAFFPFPPGPVPESSNISFAVQNADGTWSEHPRAKEIMASVNNVVSPKSLRYGPSSFDTDALELFFTVRLDEKVVSGLFVARRNSKNDVYGEPERIVLPDGEYLEPEAPTLSPDGNLMMFSRLDCSEKYGCQYINIYSMTRN